MPQLQIIDATKKHGLSRGKIACVGEVATVNIARGCAGRCVFCYVRSLPGVSATDKLMLYRDIAGQLRQEIDSRRRRRPLPGYVVFSTASDAFLGGEEVLAVTRACVEVLLRRGIGVSVATRGAIPEEVIEIFSHYADRVQVTIPLVSMSDEYTRAWEPGTALPAQRIFVLQQLHRAGLQPQIQIEPIIPFVNDATDDLREVISAAVGMGQDRAMVSFLQLRRGVADQIREEAPSEARRLVLGCFPSLQRSAQQAYDHLQPRQALSALRRIQRVGREHGLRVQACRCQNPGLPAGRCAIEPPDPHPRGQPPLFAGEG